MEQQDINAVGEANQAFYKAFESLDIKALEEAWVRGDHVKCVHPGWPLLTGWAAVRKSWERIFTSTESIQFILTDVQIQVSGRLGWVTLTENILSGVGENMSTTSVLATNLFERTEDGWHIIHHHASHILQRPSGGSSAPH
jgi:ketosteroid isomerase-like protein